MHSPDMKISNEDMTSHFHKVLEFAKDLEPYAPELKDLGEEITQFNNILDKNFSHTTQNEVDGKLEDIRSMKEIQKVLDREQEAMKEKIEDILLRFEGNQEEATKEEPQGMNNLLDFLDQNKDLLENLGPQVTKLKEMQDKVDQHDQQITNLTVRVDQLEEVTKDPMCSDKPPRYKNHLLEFSCAKKWLDPKCIEDREAQGYRGRVEVNGQIFTGKQVWNSRKAAHQEVAQIALEQLQSEVEITNEPSSSSTSSVIQTDMSSTSSTGITFFGKVIVDLNQEVESDGCYSTKEEANESAYKVLWKHLQGVMAPIQDQTYNSAIMEYFMKLGFQKPAEDFVPNDDNTTVCKLKLSRPFTFYDRDGSTKKKQAEQQAAKVALQHLSGILNCAPISDTEKNFKSILKERLEAHGFKNPMYETEQKDGSSEESVNCGISPDLSNRELDFEISITQATVKPDSELESQSISTPMELSPHQVSVSDNVLLLPDPQDSSSPGSHRKRARIDCPEIYELFNVFNLKPPHVKVEDIKCDQNFICTVGINFKNFSFTNKNGYDSKKEAIRKTYLLFGCAMAIFDPSTDERKSSEQVKQHFSQNSLALPQEDFEGSTKPFYCSLKDITYNVDYEGQGSSESEAKLHALQKALSSLSPLFDYPSLTGANTAEEVENQLSSMLKRPEQKDPIISQKDPLKKACVQLSFNNFTVKCTCKGSKKAARNHLSSRILGLLGVKTDEWFIKKNLPQPVFEDTEEALGAKATFSVQLTCHNAAWEDNWERAKKKLLEELKLNRFQFLTD